MRHLIFSTLAVLGLVSVLPSSVESCGKRMAPLSPTVLAPQADVVVVGKVTSIEDEYIQIGEGENQPLFRIANVKVTDNLLGPKGVSSVRVAFHVGANTVSVMPTDGKTNYRGSGSVALEVDQEGVFLLSRRAKADFYTILSDYRTVGFLPKAHPNFHDDLEKITGVTKVIKNPITLLNSKNDDERANALTTMYQRCYEAVYGRSGNLKVEELPADLNKAMLKALLETPNVTIVGSRYQMFASLLGEELKRLNYVSPHNSNNGQPATEEMLDKSCKDFLTKNFDDLKITRRMQ